MRSGWMDDAFDGGRRGASPGNWSPEVWAWSPAKGPWTPAAGRPRAGVTFEVTTAFQPAGETYDYWRQTVFYDFAADRPEPGRREAFQADAWGLAAPRGSLFAFSAGALSGERTARQHQGDGNDELTFGLVFAGRRRQATADGEVEEVGPGGMFIYDAARPARVSWTSHKGVQLVVPRSQIPLAGGSGPPAARLRRALDRSPLAPALKGQLDLLGRYGASLPARELETLFGATVDLLAAALGAGSAGVIGEDAVADEVVGAGLLVAARRFIEVNLANPDLDPAGVARGVGCSRATLYRLFAGRDLTVAGVIREARLQRFMGLVRRAPPDATLASLAAACGFLDPSNFNKLFKARFGVSPGEMRRAPH